MTDWNRDLPPSQEGLIRGWIEHHLQELHVAMPGRVERYDHATQTADVLPLVRHGARQPDGSTAMEDLPVIPTVPVLWPRAGGWFMAMPLAVGDTVQLLVNSAAIGHWRAGGGAVTDPGDLRRHHLSHAVAIPGLATRAQRLKHAPPASHGMVFGQDDDGGTRVTIDSNGTIIVTRAATELLRIETNGEVSLGGAVGAQFVALSNLVDARLGEIKAIFTGLTPVTADGTALKTAFTGWNPPTVAATKGKSR